MKKTIVFILMFFSFVLVGCNKNPDVESTTSSNTNDTSTETQPVNSDTRDSSKDNPSESQEEPLNQSSGIDDYKDDDDWKGQIF